MTTEERKQVLRQIVTAAVAAERAAGCPAEVVTAQCILESGWLADAPANNCFGIKSYPGAFGRQLLSTREWFTGLQLQHFLSLGDGRTAELVQPESRDAVGRKLYDVHDWFATFPTLDACFERRVALFGVGRYAPFAGTYRADRNVEAYIRGIAPIYAPAPDHADTPLDSSGSRMCRRPWRRRERRRREPRSHNPPLAVRRGHGPALFARDPSVAAAGGRRRPRGQARGRDGARPQGSVRLSPRWEFAIGTVRSGDHKESTGRAEGASGELSQGRFGRLRF